MILTAISLPAILVPLDVAYCDQLCNQELRIINAMQIRQKWKRRPLHLAAHLIPYLYCELCAIGYVAWLREPGRLRDLHLSEPRGQFFAASSIREA